MRFRTISASAVIAACAAATALAGTANAAEGDTAGSITQQKFVLQQTTPSGQTEFYGVGEWGPQLGAKGTTLEQAIVHAANYSIPKVGKTGQIVRTPDVDDTYTLCLTAKHSNPGTPGWQPDPSAPLGVTLDHCDAEAAAQRWTIDRTGRIASAMGGFIVADKNIQLGGASNTRLVDTEQTTTPGPGDPDPENPGSPDPEVPGDEDSTAVNPGFLPDGSVNDGGFTVKPGTGTGPVEPEVPAGSQVGAVRFGNASDMKSRALIDNLMNGLLGSYALDPGTSSQGAKAQTPVAGSTGPVKIGGKCLTAVFKNGPVSGQTCTGAANQQFTNRTIGDGIHVLQQGDKVLTASTTTSDRTLQLDTLDEMSTTKLQQVRVG